MGTTVTWLLALHLFFTYAPKAADLVQSALQIKQEVGQLRPTLTAGVGNASRIRYVSRNRGADRAVPAGRVRNGHSHK